MNHFCVMQLQDLMQSADLDTQWNICIALYIPRKNINQGIWSTCHHSKVSGTARLCVTAEVLQPQQQKHCASTHAPSCTQPSVEMWATRQIFGLDQEIELYWHRELGNKKQQPWEPLCKVNGGLKPSATDFHFSTGKNPSVAKPICPKKLSPRSILDSRVHCQVQSAQCSSCELCSPVKHSSLIYSLYKTQNVFGHNFLKICC